MRKVYDAVVIGSGFGGAIMACRLAQAGRSVAVLEKGRRWDKTEFSTHHGPGGRFLLAKRQIPRIPGV